MAVLKINAPADAKKVKLATVAQTNANVIVQKAKNALVADVLKVNAPADAKKVKLATVAQTNANVIVQKARLVLVADVLKTNVHADVKKARLALAETTNALAKARNAPATKKQKQIKNVKKDVRLVSNNLAFLRY